MSARSLIVVSLVVGLVGLFVGCGGPPEDQGPPGPPTVTVARPVVLPLVEWDEYIGRVDAIDSVDVRARVAGYLEEVYFDEGQIVEAGDLLAVIDPRPFEAAVNAARARMREAEATRTQAEAQLKVSEARSVDADAAFALAAANVKRARSLTESGAISREEADVRESELTQAAAGRQSAAADVAGAEANIETAAAGVETAKAEVESALLDLQYSQVRAPIRGRIGRRLVTEGNLVQGGPSAQATTLTSIVSLDPVHVYFDANETEFLKYSRLARSGKRASSRDVRNPVLLQLVDETGYPHRGHMDFVDNRLDPNTGTMRGRAILRNTEGILTPGLFARVRLPGSGRYEAILLPDRAIGSDQSEQFVYVVDVWTAEDVAAARRAKTAGSGNAESSGDEASEPEDASEEDEADPDAGGGGPNVGDLVARRRVVKLGPLRHGLRIIREGVTPDDRVVIEGLQSVRPDTPIDVDEQTVEPQPSDLPDDYEVVPEEDWIDRRPPDVPDNLPKNAPYDSNIDVDDRPYGDRPFRRTTEGAADRSAVDRPPADATDDDGGERP